MNNYWSINEYWSMVTGQWLHFDLSNEDGDRFIYKIEAITIRDHFGADDMLANFNDNLHHMLTMAISLFDDQHFSDLDVFEISKNLFNRYYPKQ